MSKELDNVPFHSVRLNVKPRPEESSEDELPMDIPILPPHELTEYLLSAGHLTLDASKARQHWDHVRAQGVPWMAGSIFQSSDEAAKFQPFAVYADEAEYTVSKEKILMVFCSH